MPTVTTDPALAQTAWLARSAAQQAAALKARQGKSAPSAASAAENADYSEATHQALTEYVEKSPEFASWLAARFAAKGGALPARHETLEILRQKLKTRDLSEKNAAAMALTGEAQNHVEAPSEGARDFAKWSAIFLAITGAGAGAEILNQMLLGGTHAAGLAVGAAAAIASAVAFLTFDKPGPFQSGAKNLVMVAAWLATAAVGASQILASHGASPEAAGLAAAALPLGIALLKLRAWGRGMWRALQGVAPLVAQDRAAKNLVTEYDTLREGLLTEYFRHRPADYLEFIRNFLPEYLKKQRAAAEAKREEHQATIRELERAREKTNEKIFPSPAQRALVEQNIGRELARYQELVQQMDATVLKPMDRALKETLPAMRGELEKLIADLNEEAGRNKDQNDVLELLKRVGGEKVDIEQALVEEQAERMRAFEERLERFFVEIRATQAALVEVDRSLARLRVPG